MSFREAPPEWLVEQHTARPMPAWRPCSCQREGSGHRRWDLECCGQVYVDGCRDAPLPTMCR